MIEALRIIVNDPDVKTIFINIFGGLARVDIVAEGVVDAVKELNIKQPLVVRLNGSNVEEGRRVLHDSGIDIQTADELGGRRRTGSRSGQVGKTPSTLDQLANSIEQFRVRPNTPERGTGA